MSFIHAFACEEIKRRRKIHAIRKNRNLRSSNNMMGLLEPQFIESFRIDKDTFRMVADTIAPHLNSSIHPNIQLGAVLRFLATGSYQLAIAKDHQISIGRSTFSKILHNVIGLLEYHYCSDYIKLQMTDEEVTRSKEYFYSQYRLPSVIACVDGTHVKIVKPQKDESTFLNRKGYFSLNAMVVCNYNLEILAIDATHPGACHDAFIWKYSDARNYLSRIQNCFVLADSAYTLEPFVLTPYRGAQYGTMQHIFNKKHAEARNIVERTIGVLKSRFRCLQSTLHYDPKFVCSLINVCCAFHNICRRLKTIPQDLFDNETVPIILPYFENEEESSTEEEGLIASTIRNRIAQSLV